MQCIGNNNIFFIEEFVNGCVGGDCFQGAGSEIGLYTVQAINAMYR